MEAKKGVEVPKISANLKSRFVSKDYRRMKQTFEKRIV